MSQRKSQGSGIAADLFVGSRGGTGQVFAAAGAREAAAPLTLFTGRYLTGRSGAGCLRPLSSSTVRFLPPPIVTPANSCVTHDIAGPGAGRHLASAVGPAHAPSGRLAGMTI